MKSQCCSSLVVKDFVGNYRCSRCLLPCKYTYNYRLFYIIFFICLISIGFYSQANAPKSKKMIIQVDKYIDSDIHLCDSCILQELRKDSIICPEIVLNQIKIETNYYKSTVCTVNHNLVGLKYIARKPYQIKELNDHAYYSSYKNSLKDYKLTQSFYLENLQKKYSESKNYSKLIKSI